METGAYQHPNDVIARALEVLHSEDEWLLGQKDLIGKKIERAFEQFERGEFFSSANARVEMEKRKAVWLAARSTDAGL
jgi:hypothetical protein